MGLADQKSSDDGVGSQQPPTSTSYNERVLLNVNQFVVVNFEGSLYPGLITEKTSNNCRLSVMEKTPNIGSSLIHSMIFGTQMKGRLSYTTSKTYKERIFPDSRLELNVHY